MAMPLTSADLSIGSGCGRVAATFLAVIPGLIGDPLDRSSVWHVGLKAFPLIPSGPSGASGPSGPRAGAAVRPWIPDQAGDDENR